MRVIEVLPQHLWQVRTQFRCKILWYSYLKNAGFLSSALENALKFTVQLFSRHCWAHPLPLLFLCCWLESTQTHKRAEYCGFHHIYGQGTSAALVDSDPKQLLVQDSSGIVGKPHSHIAECAALEFVSALKRIK